MHLIAIAISLYSRVVEAHVPHMEAAGYWSLRCIVG